MNISEISSAGAYAANEGPLSLKKAIKAYRDNMLTGLTDEEKEEIEKLAKQYLEENPIKTKQDRDAFNNYVKSLMRKFGFKGDVDEYALAIDESVQAGAVSGDKPAGTSISDLYQKKSLGAMSVKNKFLL